MAFDLNTLFASVIAAFESRTAEIVEERIDAHHSAYDHTLLSANLLWMHSEIQKAVAEATLTLTTRMLAAEERLTALEGTAAPAQDDPTLLARLARAEDLLGHIFMVHPSKMTYTPESMPDTSDGFEDAVLNAISNKADAVIETLADNDCSAFVSDGVKEAVKEVIENGDFSVEFNTGRSRRY